MNKKPNKLVTLLIIVAVAVGAVMLFFGNDPEHIEDTNGAGDYSLATITDEQIIEKSLGSRNVAISYGGSFSNDVEFSSNQFSGVYEIANTYYLLESDYVLDLLSFEVTQGNFKMVVVNEGKIVATIEPGQIEPVYLENVKGDISLIIAGESAAFSFSMSDMDFELIGGTVE